MDAVDPSDQNAYLKLKIMNKEMESSLTKNKGTINKFHGSKERPPLRSPEPPLMGLGPNLGGEDWEQKS
jgi:hypothetical protein